MAKTEESATERDEDEMLPDEREAVAERLESLEESERLSVDAVAAELGIDLDE